MSDEENDRNEISKNYSRSKHISHWIRSEENEFFVDKEWTTTNSTRWCRSDGGVIFLEKLCEICGWCMLSFKFSMQTHHDALTAILRRLSKIPTCTIAAQNKAARECSIFTTGWVMADIFI